MKSCGFKAEFLENKLSLLPKMKQLILWKTKTKFKLFENKTQFLGKGNSVY